MITTSDMIWQKLNDIEKKLDQLLKKEVEHSIEEISLGKAAKLLHLGSETIIKYVESGKLKARTYRESKHRKRYRFRIADIKDFQQRQSTILVSDKPVYKSGQQIWNDITAQNSTRKKRRT